MSWIILIIALYGLLCFYVGLRMWQWLRLFLPPWSGALFWLIYLAVAASLFIERLLEPAGAGRLAGHVRNGWLGVFAFGLLAVLLIDLARLLRWLFHRLFLHRPVLPGSSRRIALVTGAAACLLVAFIGIYASWNARQIRLVTVDIQIDKPIAEADKNLNVVLASDLHLGLVMDHKRLRPFIAAVNTLEPDLVLLAGDLFDGDYEELADPQAAWTELAGLQADYGVFACLGNHDAGEDLDKMLAFLEKADIRVLLDETVQLGDVVLAGRLDLSPIGYQKSRQPLEWLLTDVDPTRPILLMDHSPFGIEEAKTQPVDLLVSGHTHNGQVFPGNLIVAAIYENGYGYRKFGNMQTIVTSGVGTWGPPWRLASQAEIVLIRITFSETGQAG